MTISIGESPEPTRFELEEAAAALKALYQGASAYMVYRLKREPESPYFASVEVVSPSITSILGATDPKDIATWFAAVHHDDLDKLRAAQQRCFHDAMPLDEVFRVTKDGEVRYLRAVSHPVRNKAEDVTHYNGFVVDVTERTQAQQEALRLKEKLDQAQRWEALGALASAVAHDFNNLLQGVLGTCLLMSPQISEQELRDYQSEMELLVQRGARMTKDLLSYTGARGGELTESRLEPSIDRIVRLTQSMFVNLEVEVEMKAGDASAWLDEALFEQSLLNLCINAAHACNESGKIRIVVELLDSFQMKSAVGFDASGEFLDVCVSDRGCGIAPQHLDRIFDHFFTTKPGDKGTGLGLASVKRAAAKHGGFVRVESTLGEGSSFHFVIPAASGRPARRAKKGKRSTPLNAGDRILLVEDDPSVRLVLTKLLKREGFEVEAAEESVRALQLLVETKGDYRLLIADLVMPGPGGLELLRRCRNLFPALPILITSGDAGGRHLEEIKSHRKCGFLAKPFGRAELYEAIHQIV